MTFLFLFCGYKQISMVCANNDSQYTYIDPDNMFSDDDSIDFRLQLPSVSLVVEIILLEDLDIS